MTMDIPTLHTYREMWASRIGVNLMDVVIAGGAVRDVLLEREPKDVDVFILGCQPNQELALNSQLIEQPDWHKSEPFLQGSTMVDGIVHQVMATTETNVVGLLDSFDWNVSRFALSHWGMAGNSHLIVADGKPLELHKVTFPISTMRRGFRYSERFGMVFDRADIRYLAWLINRPASPKG